MSKKVRLWLIRHGENEHYEGAVSKVKLTEKGHRQADLLGNVRGLPFEIKQRLPIELNDGKGSYICEYGHIHDYSKFDFEAVEREISDPATKKYNNVDEMWTDLLDPEDENGEV